MKRAVQLLLVAALTAAIVVATVACCCIAPAVMAHLHKTVKCVHCGGADHHKASNPADPCLNQLTTIDVAPTAAIAAPTVFLPDHVFLKQTTDIVPRVSVAVYPRGSPPWTVSLAPLYLRTFTLRI